MTPRKWSRLVLINVRRSPRQFALSAFGIAVGISSLAFFGGLSEGVKRVVFSRVFPADRIELEPEKPRLDVGLSALGGLMGGGPRTITDETVAQLAAVPGVKRVAPRMRIAFPSKAWGGERFFGSPRYAELLGDGIDSRAVADEAASIGPEPFADLEPLGTAACASDADCHVAGEYCAWDINRCQKPVPALLSRFLFFAFWDEGTSLFLLIARSVQHAAFTDPEALQSFPTIPNRLFGI